MSRVRVAQLLLHFTRITIAVDYRVSAKEKMPYANMVQYVTATMRYASVFQYGRTSYYEYPTDETVF